MVYLFIYFNSNNCSSTLNVCYANNLNLLTSVNPRFTVNCQNIHAVLLEDVKIFMLSKKKRKNNALQNVPWGPQRPHIRETMHSALGLRCTIRAQLISATRGCASPPKVLAMATDFSATY